MILAFAVVALFESGATLAGWNARVWDRLTDREGNVRRWECHEQMRPRAWGGDAPETEPFRRWDPALLSERPECAEYIRLLERAYLPFLAEERAWARGGDGLHVLLGSASAELLLTDIEMRKRVPLGETLALDVSYRRAHDVTADRDLWRLGLSRNPVFFVAQVHFFKPEVDVEAGSSWRSPDGRFRARGGVAWLDTFSDFNFFLVGQRDRTAVDVFVRQGTPKLAARLDAEGSIGIVRAELFAGGALPHGSRLSFPNDPLAAFRQVEEAQWLGALGEIHVHPTTAVGGWAATARTRISRTPLEAGAPRGTLREEETRAALFAASEPLPWLYVESYVERVTRPERGSGDLRQGARNEEETSFVIDAVLFRRETVGFHAGWVRDTWRVDDRDPLAVTSEGQVHDALRTRMMVRFHERAWFRFGANWGRPLFQGGTLVLYTAW